MHTSVEMNIMLIVCLKGYKVVMIVHSVIHKAILNTYKVSIKTFNRTKQPCLAAVLKVGRLPEVDVAKCTLGISSSLASCQHWCATYLFCQ